MKNTNFKSTLKLIFKSKVTFSIIFAAIFIIACQQNNQPSPSGSSSTTTGGNTPGTIAAQQQMIQGDWILRQIQTFTVVTINGVSRDSMLRYQNVPNTNTCHINLTNNPGSSTGYFYYNGLSGLVGAVGSGCGDTPNQWRIPALNKLTLNIFTHDIIFLSNDSLVVRGLDNGMSGNLVRCVFNKTGLATGLNPLEKLLIGNSLSSGKTWNLLKTESNLGVTYPTYPSTISFYGSPLVSGYYYCTGSGYPFNFGPGSWQVVEGKLSLNGIHRRIDTLTTNKLVFSTFPQIGSNYFERWTFQ